jgi:hypothetical protein
MGVFDPRQGQVLISPVTEFYRGKAIRQDQADKEQMAELRGVQIDLAKEELARAPKEWDMAKKLAESKQEQIDEEIAQGKRDGKWQSMQRSTQILEPWVQDIVSLMGEDGSNAASAMKTANATLPQVLEQLAGVVSEDEIEELNQLAGADRVLDLNEFMLMKRRLESFMSPKGRRTLSLEESMALPGMTENRAKNAVVQEDASGEIFIDDAPTGMTAEDVAARGGDPRTPSQEGSDYSENLAQWNNTTDIEEMISTALPRVIDNPAAVGITGKFAQLGSGLLTATGQKEAARLFSEHLSGASPEEVAQLKAELQALRGQLLPIVIGQTSRARLSDQERKVGDRAVALIDELETGGDLATTYPQVIGALTQFYEEGWAKKYRLAQQSKHFEYPYDLNNQTEVMELIEQFERAGINDVSIVNGIRRLALIQGATIPEFQK